MWHSPLQLFSCTRTELQSERKEFPHRWTLLWSACKRGLPFPSPVVLVTCCVPGLSPSSLRETLFAHPQLSSPVGRCFQRGSGQAPRSPAITDCSVLVAHLATFAPLGNVRSPSASEGQNAVSIMFIMNSDVHLDENRVHLFHLPHLYLQLHNKKKSRNKPWCATNKLFGQQL